jgi:two-component system, chemotaxis family, chemotaxis protein CheY
MPRARWTRTSNIIGGNGVGDKPRKILIVEDSSTMCKLYRIVLGDRPGTELVFARHGVEGLDRVAQQPDLSLMILDINMPHMDGLEFLRRAREDLGAIALPAIVTSTEGAEADRRAAREAGATKYLRKPWTPEQLHAAIDAAIQPARP